jgi:DNA-binding transcriptional LysR family regulator
MFDPRRLQLLVELDRRGSVTAVAEALAYSPSAVSQQLTQLEKDAGVKLTEKAGRRLVLTEAGKRFARHGARVHADLEAILADLESSNENLVATLKLGSIESILRTVVPPALTALRENHPGLRVECQEMEPVDAIAALSTGVIDLALVDSYTSPFVAAPDSTLVTLRIASDPIFIALAETHPLAGAATVKLADLRAEAWITPEPGSAHTKYQIEICMNYGGFPPDIRHRTNNLGVSLRLVATGHGVAMIPRLGITDASGIVYRDVVDASLSRELYVVLRESSTPRPALSALTTAVLHSERVASFGLADRAPSARMHNRREVR